MVDRVKLQLDTDRLNEIRQSFLLKLKSSRYEFNDLLKQLKTGKNQLHYVDILGALRKKAHSVSGIAASFGYKELGDIARRIEENCASGLKTERVSVPEDLQLLTELTDRLQSHIDVCLQENSKPSSTT